MATAQRIDALDIARGIAILGMFFAHAAPINESSPLVLKALAAGAQVTAPLFLLLVGMSAGLATGGAVPAAANQRGGLRWQAARRALALVLLGLLLWQIPSGIAVVLDYIGVTLLLMIPVLFAPRWVPAVLAVLALVASPLIQAWSTAAGVPTAIAGDPVATKLASWFFLGPQYWAVMFLVFALTGLWVARGAMSGWRLMRLGFVAVLVGGALSRITDFSPHPGSNSPAGNLVALGCALFLVGALLWASTTSVGRRVLAALGPVRDAGRLSLSLYALQVLLFAAYLAWVGWIASWALLVGVMVISLVVAALWAWLVRHGMLPRRGPLEWLVAWVAGR